MDKSKPSTTSTDPKATTAPKPRQVRRGPKNVNRKISGIAASMGTPMADNDPKLLSALAPRNTGAPPSVPKDNEILKEKSVLVEGYSLVPRKQTSFFDDYSHYIEIC